MAKNKNIGLTEEAKIAMIRVYAKRANPAEVRKQIGKIWNLKKTARNEKWWKIFGGGLKYREKASKIMREAGIIGEANNKTSRTLKSVASPQVNISGDKAIAEVKNSKVIYTLEELVKVCGINLDEWNVSKFVANSYGDNFQAKAEFTKKKEKKDLQNLLEHFVEEADNFAPQKFFFDAPSKDKDCLYVLNIQDLHLSKLAWSKENNAKDYDISIAKQVFTDAVNDLMKKVPKERVEEIIVICGSDFFQCDREGTTTAGTFVDTDSRISKSFEEGVGLLTKTIEQLAISHKVRVMCYPGNHDDQISMYAGYYLGAWFKNHANVTVDNGPKPRKYYGYGNTLLAFVHGNEEKAAQLPLLIMRENMDTVSKYKYIECLSGHYHSESVSEQNGVKLRTAPSLSSEDFWHTKKGFWGNIRTSQGILYQKEHGIEAIYYSKPV